MIYTCSKGPIGSRTVYGLSSSLGLFSPLAGYRVYDVKYAKFVSCWCLFEMCIKFLNENGFGL